MSLAEQVGTAVVVLAAAAAAVSLWRGADRHAGSVRRGYWWLVLASVLWGVGVIATDAVAGPATGAPFPLTPADLPGLLALAAFVAGLVRLPAGRAEPGGGPLAQRVRGKAPGAVAAHLADGYVLASALFVIGWIVAFGPAYPGSGDDPGMFAMELVHPLADLVALGAVLPFAVAAGRRGITAYLALLALSAADALAVAPRVGGGYPALGAEVLQVVGFTLIGVAPWAGGPRKVRLGSAAAPRRTGLDAATVVASLAATVAALVVIVWALAGGPSARPVLAFAGGTAVLALAARVLSLLRRDSAAARLWRESGRQFRELADRTSDVVLVCDFGGSIRYASPAVADYGYSPEDLTGRMLADFLHPEDRSAGTRAAREVIRAVAQQAGRYPFRIRAADGTWRYVESTVSRYRNPGGPDQLLVTARDVSDQVELRRRVAHLTFHDGLTGLPNRAYIEDRARRGLSVGHPHVPQQAAKAGVILVDLDSFTGVNDASGHSAGDLLLAQVARRVRAVVPPQDTVARWGGDEFAVLVEGAASTQEIRDIAQRILASIAGTPFRVADRDVSLAVSVGVAVADGSPAGYVWRNADVAVSRAKEAGGGRVEVYAAQLHADVRRRLELAGDLHQAVSEGQLELHYQPIVELAGSRVAGAGALALWREDGVAVPPGEFLDVAESSGVIVALGDWMLREACAQGMAWRRSGLDLDVWVRCTPRQVAASGFSESVLGALAAAGLPPGALTLEITERALIDRGSAARGALEGLRERGVRLAVGASGTDYAAVAQLRQLPVDVIKIGSPLVARLGTDTAMATLIRVMVQVVKDLDIGVVAEGIEHPDQLDLLRDMGCALGRGPALGDPMTACEMERLARARGEVTDPARDHPAGHPGGVSPAETNALSS